LLQKAIAEREDLKRALATQSAELFALQDRFSSTIANARNQLSTLNRSLKTTIAERQALTEALATQTAELSLTRDQLSSANAVNAEEKVSSDLLKQKVQGLEGELQRTAENLRRARNDTPRSSDGRPSVHRCPTRSTQSINASAGPSQKTSRNFQESPAISPQTHQDGGRLPRQCKQRENTQPRMIECGVCVEKYPDGQIISLAPCGHVFCRQCIGSHVGAKLQQRLFPVSCPVCMAECKKRNPGST
jgi:hypothetical protein